MKCFIILLAFSFFSLAHASQVTLTDQDDQALKKQAVKPLVPFYYFAKLCSTLDLKLEARDTIIFVKFISQDTFIITDRKNKSNIISVIFDNNSQVNFQKVSYFSLENLIKNAFLIKDNNRRYYLIYTCHKIIIIDTDSKSKQTILLPFSFDVQESVDGHIVIKNLEDNSFYNFIYQNKKAELILITTPVEFKPSQEWNRREDGPLLADFDRVDANGCPAGKDLSTKGYLRGIDVSALGMSPGNFAILGRDGDFLLWVKSKTQE
jgi:hypothetical protein